MDSFNFYISADKSKLNIDLIYDYLSNRSYWAKGRNKEIIATSISHSICFGVYNKDDQQIGFARVVTDFVVYAYLLDLFILESHQGQGLGKLLMTYIMNFESLKTVQNWALRTKDAHGLYEKFGFTIVSAPERLMGKSSVPAY